MREIISRGTKFSKFEELLWLLGVQWKENANFFPVLIRFDCVVGVLDWGGREGGRECWGERGAVGCGDGLVGAWWYGSTAASSADAVKGARGAWILSPLPSWAYFPLGLEDCVCLSTGGVGTEITAQAALGRGSSLWVTFLDHMGKLRKMLWALHCAPWPSISLSRWCLHKTPSTRALLYHPGTPPPRHLLPWNMLCRVQWWLVGQSPAKVCAASFTGWISPCVK